VDYIKLRSVNDWGHVTLRYDDKVVPFPIGNMVGIRWPDESETAESIVYRDEVRWVYDHGDSYPVKNQTPCILIHHRGIMRTVDVSEVLVWEPDIKTLLGIYE
jgi:hypothetical protein